MNSKINFVQVNENYGEVLQKYVNVFSSLIDPIKIHLPGSSLSYRALPRKLNVHCVITEQGYDQTARIGKGLSIFIAHGLADKRWRDGGRVKLFDYVGVPGPAWAKKMIDEGISEEKIITIGFPKLDEIFKKAKTTVKNNGKIVILWAPTHTGSITSYPQFNEYLDKFPSEFEVVSSPHPYNKPSHKPTMDELLRADVVISDTGSMVYEAWALGIPVIFPDWIVKQQIIDWFPSFERTIYSEEIGLHARDFNHLVELVYMTKETTIDQKTREYAESIFPASLRGCSGEVTAKQLIEIVKERL